MTRARFYARMLAVPLAAFLAANVLLAVFDADSSFARWMFFDTTHGTWLGAHSWFVNKVVHTGGRWLIRVVTAASALMWLGTFAGVMPQWRRPAGFFTLAVVLTVGITGWLKTITNVDCPWDLAPFGGQYPHVPLFGDRPDELRYGRCFPAAHASSGYALMALYFLFRDRNARLAYCGLAIGVFAGLVFGFAQQSRGAHFLSHDLWSAMIAWTVPLTLYVWSYRCRLHDPLVAAGATQAQ